jgi:hypothetical protein
VRKLALSMTEKDIQAARRIAREHHTSISDLFSRLIRVMDAKRRMKPSKEDDLGPLTRKLSGIISLPEGRSDREIIEDAILEQHGFTK